VRYELEKMLIEKGLLRPRDPDDENGIIESETVSSMRYELSKLQKELLRYNSNRRGDFIYLD
jgi:hypothetical protein